MLPPLSLITGATGQSPLPGIILDALDDAKPLLPALAEQVKNPFVKALIWIGGLLVLLGLGLIVVKIILYLSRRLFRRSKIDHAAIPFLVSVIKVVCYVLLFIAVIGSTGLMDPTSLVAILSVAGLAISLAVQDSLSNLAGGALLLINKPFSREDFVDIDGTTGTIMEISLTYTILRTVDNKRICIPNGQVTKAQITNFSSEPYRRLEVVLTIDRSADMELAEAILLETIKKHPMTLAAPPASAQVSGHNDLGTTISCRVWATRENFWSLNYDLQKQLKQALDQNGIGMPVRNFPTV